MSPHESLVRLRHMLDHAREAVAMAAGIISPRTASVRIAATRVPRINGRLRTAGIRRRPLSREAAPFGSPCIHRSARSPFRQTFRFCYKNVRQRCREAVHVRSRRLRLSFDNSPAASNRYERDATGTWRTGCHPRAAARSWRRSEAGTQVRRWPSGVRCTRKAIATRCMTDGFRVRPICVSRSAVRRFSSMAASGTGMLAAGGGFP